MGLLRSPGGGGRRRDVETTRRPARWRPPLLPNAWGGVVRPCCSAMTVSASAYSRARRTPSMDSPTLGSKLRRGDTPRDAARAATSSQHGSTHPGPRGGTGHGENVGRRQPRPCWPGWRRAQRARSVHRHYDAHMALAVGVGQGRRCRADRPVRPASRPRGASASRSAPACSMSSSASPQRGSARIQRRMQRRIARMHRADHAAPDVRPRKRRQQGYWRASAPAAPRGPISAPAPSSTTRTGRTGRTSQFSTQRVRPLAARWVR